MGEKLRRCKINGKEYGYFHGIYPWSDVVGPSFAVGGPPGGTIACPVAVVELMDGSLRIVDIKDVVLYVPGAGTQDGGSREGRGSRGQ